MLLQKPFTNVRFPTECPAPGIYPKTPSDEYHAWNAVSSTLLRECSRSLRHAKYFLANPDRAEHTQAMIFGSALHCAILEPEVYAKSKIAWPINEKTGEPYGASSKAFQSFAADHHQKHVIVRVEDEAAINRIIEELRELPTGAQLLSLPREFCECAIVWDEPDLGVRCKARIDTYAESVAFDLKTTRDGAVIGFGRDAVHRGYLIQASLYARGLKQAFGLEDWPDYMIVALESDEPHIPAIYHVEPDLLEAIWNENTKLIRDLVTAINTNQWPGYTRDVAPLRIPAHALPLGYESEWTL